MMCCQLHIDNKIVVNMNKSVRKEVNKKDILKFVYIKIWSALSGFLLTIGFMEISGFQNSF